MNIKPTYSTFEQAKWLKEKNFFPEIHKVSEWNRMPKITLAYDEHGVSYNPSMPRVSHGSSKNHYLAPEQWQVVEWLRINHKIWVSCELDEDMYKPRIYTFHNGNKHVPLGFKNYLTPQQAYSAAFDYILNNLI
jgi:hypothetical protein